ncbi:MAG: hypothetical protein U0R80_02325 [Nocardioidaceae bacterium]
MAGRRVTGAAAGILLLGSLLAACGESGAGDTPGADEVADQPAAAATASDARDDTWLEDVSHRRSRQVVNVDLTDLSATYDDTGLVLTVTYARPIDPSATHGLQLVADVDHDEASRSDTMALSWSSERPTQVKVSDTVDVMYHCRAGVQTDFAAGRVTLTLPATPGCLGRTAPDRMRVLHVTSYAQGAMDTMFSEGQDAKAADLWVDRG